LFFLTTSHKTFIVSIQSSHCSSHFNIDSFAKRIPRFFATKSTFCFAPQKTAQYMTDAPLVASLSAKLRYNEREITKKG
ncbi:MAG: hypothetical protein DSZ10_06075, partial [Sulfurovum sp.]